MRRLWLTLWTVPFLGILVYESVALWHPDIPTLSGVVWWMQDHRLLSIAMIWLWGWLTLHWFVLPRTRWRELRHEVWAAFFALVFALLVV
jgi:hypothetical protein